LGAPSIRVGNGALSLPENSAMGFSGGAAAASPAARYGSPAAPTYGIPTGAPFSVMTLLAQYVGDDVTSGGTGTWTGTGSSAADLTGQGDATPTLTGLRTIPATDYVDVNGNRYQTASAPGISLGTQDLLVLAYLQLSSSGNTIPISNRAGFNSGFELMVQDNGNVRCYVDTVSLGVVNDFVSTDTDPGAWTLAGCIIDRDGYMGAWAPGGASTSPVNIAAGSAERLDNDTDPFTIGASADGGDSYVDSIAWVQVWGCDGCLSLSSGGTDYDDELQAMASDVTGVTAGTDTATTTVRGGSAYMRVCDRETDSVVYELMGANMPRVELACTGRDWTDYTGTTLYRGLHVERNATNSVTAPTDPTNAAWTKTNVTAVTDSSCGGTLFAGDTSCTEIRASSTSSTVKTVSFSGANNGTDDTTWMALKQGARRFVKVAVDATTWANYELNGCSVGNTGAGATYTYAQMTRNGWCYVGIGGNVAHATVTLYVCTSNEDAATCSANTASDTTSAQIEIDYAGSIASTANEIGYHSPVYGASRPSDEVTWSPTLTAGPQTFIVDLTTDRDDSVLSLYNDANNYHHLSRTGTDARCRARNTGGVLFDIDTNTTFSDNQRHIIRSVFAADAAECFVDGVSGGTDTDTGGNAALAYTTLIAGENGDPTSRVSGNIWDWWVYDGAYAPGEAGTGSDAP
jgi:hypothetical protein